MSESAGTSTKSVRSVLLGMLAEFDRVCSENGLTYIAAYGTMLGAVRDGGFAPGDDDLDVAMPRHDYERLIELAKTGAFGDPYYLQTPENDPACFFGGYAKLRDSSTSAIDLPYIDKAYNQGIWMDVMPLDNCPVDDSALRLKWRTVQFWQRVLYAHTYGLDMRKFWDANPTYISAYFLVKKRVSHAAACRNLRKACMTGKATGQLAVFAKNQYFTPDVQRFAAEDVAAAQRVPFEGTTVPVMRNAEAWLAHCYGPDWKRVPDASEGEQGHDVLFDANVPYRDKIAQLEERG